MRNNSLLFTIVIPMYNGAQYIDNSIHSIVNDLITEDKLYNLFEIIIINDGSTDNSSEIAHEIANVLNSETRPNFIRVIDKENGQYGSVINRGIKEANGRYFKVLDVDDIFNTNYFVDIIKIIAGISIDIDLILTDFIFDKVTTNKQITYKWNKYFKPYEILDTQHQNYPKSLITMHSIIYRTQFLRDINYQQIEGIYYSDSYYATIPFSQATRMYYVNIPLYRYYIGRNDQSININSMVKNKAHQKMVLDTIIDDLLTIDANSLKQLKYAWSIAKNMFEWQVMIISHDRSIKNKPKEIYTLLKDILEKCKENENNLAYNTIASGVLARVVRLTKGHGIPSLIRFAEKLYARFKLNIMADWD